MTRKDAKLMWRDQPDFQKLFMRSATGWLHIYVRINDMQKLSATIIIAFYLKEHLVLQAVERINF